MKSHDRGVKALTVQQDEIQTDLEQIIGEWLEHGYLKKGDLFVIGCSTSEIAGEHIGTSGSETIARLLYEQLTTLKQKAGIDLAFQCCEHLNRALVLEREVAKQHALDEVTVVPVPSAGGAMASYAFQQKKDPVVVEHIQADAGMDIGDTFIGMHIKPVAVPIRFKRKRIGNAHTTFVRRRPKLIGGERASYQ